jgi:hypothetical protein
MNFLFSPWREINRHAFTLKEVLFVFFVIGLTFQMTISGDEKLSFTWVEIFILAMGAVFLHAFSFSKRVGMILVSDPIVWILAGWTVWGMVVWYFATDWAYGINETRWLFLSTIAYCYLRTYFHDQWNKKVAILLFLSVLIAFIADLQAVTGMFKPPFAALIEKAIFLSPTMAIKHTVAVGFFMHPNAFGGFIFWPLLISMGICYMDKMRWIGIAGIVFFGISLAFSYYRTLIIGAGLAGLLILLLQSRLTPKLWGLFSAAVCSVGLVGFLLFLAWNADSHFLKNFDFRVLQWQLVVPITAESPWTLFFGSGVSLPSPMLVSSARVDPHNAYLYMLVHYGMPGLMFYLAMVWIVLKRGWQAYKTEIFRSQPIQSALWVGFLIWFLTAFVDSRLTTPEWQFQFVLFLAFLMAGTSALGATASVPLGRESTSNDGLPANV